MHFQKQFYLKNDRLALGCCFWLLLVLSQLQIQERSLGQEFLEMKTLISPNEPENLKRKKE